MKKFIPILLATVFFFSALFTLPHYGISWDETLHFYRGQDYLRYFLTGETTYDDLPKVDLQGTNGDPNKIAIPRRSFYQSDLYNGEYMLKNDSGHPPLNDELAALSNFIFFQKLGVLGDIEAHHLFNILASSLFVFVVVSFALETMGVFASFVSFLALVTYPLFWSESHFNIKDPPEAAFFTGCIWAFWKALQKGSIRWLLISSVFFSLALGTKFNILFLPAIIIPYLLLRYRKKLLLPLNLHKIFPKKMILGFLGGMVIVGLIFLGSWPYLWQNVWNLQSIFGYYREIGTNFHYQPDNFYFHNFNMFPVLWIIFTTPPLILILFFFGLLSLFALKGEKKQLTLLWLLWLVVPLLRVTLPGTVIYGGVRQIMEFLPAMALLSGLGAWQITQINKGLVVKIVLMIIFIWPLWILIKLHPYENVYFNSLIGGLPGAYEKNFPSWGNSFGNAYFQGIKWVNENVENNSRLSLIQGTAANAPVIFLRKDIDFKSGNLSGIVREGEYLMDLTFNDSTRDFNYAWEYVENFLYPVYELKVDGVPILKVWKNDIEHTREMSKKNEVELPNPLIDKTSDNQIMLDFGKIVPISRLYLFFNPLSGCLTPKAAFVKISQDGSSWTREKDPIPFRQIKQKENISANEIEYFIAGKEARYASFVFENTNACPLNYTSAKALIFK